MKAEKKLAINYAQALFEITSSNLELLETSLNELKVINESINNTKEAKKVFETPSISKDEKKKIIETLRHSASTTIYNFLCVLIDNQRFNLLPEIQNCLIDLINKKKGIVTAQVYSTSQLESSLINKIQEALRHNISKDIKIEEKIDPSLIGGLKVKINDLVYDGSIKGKLESLKRRLG